MHGLLQKVSRIARASPGEVVILAIMAAVVTAGSATVLLRQKPPPRPPLSRIAPSPSPLKMLVVHVAGAVASPGVYELEDGSRVRDAVAAAGGAAAGANLDALNLAQVLVDGQKVWVGSGESVSEPAQEGTQNGKVNLNLATQAQLEDLPGVGPVLAERIIGYRQKKRFTSVKQLLEVEGFGPRKYESVKDLVTV